MPLTRVPWKVLDESIFEDPMEVGLLAWGLQVPGHFEGRPMSFLREYFDRVEVRHGDGESLVRGGLDAPVGRDFPEFHHADFTWGGFEHVIDLV